MPNPTTHELTATPCNTLQHTATTLQRTATHRTQHRLLGLSQEDKHYAESNYRTQRIALRHAHQLDPTILTQALHLAIAEYPRVGRCVAVCCSVLQCVAVLCSEMQALHYSAIALLSHRITQPSHYSAIVR